MKYKYEIIRQMIGIIICYQTSGLWQLGHRAKDMKIGVYFVPMFSFWLSRLYDFLTSFLSFPVAQSPIITITITITIAFIITYPFGTV